MISLRPELEDDDELERNGRLPPIQHGARAGG